MKTVQDGWESYKRNVIGEPSSETIEVVTRACFFAGATWMLHILLIEESEGITSDHIDALLSELQEAELEPIHRH